MASTRAVSGRPAIDPLFRSAADVYGRRVIGVLLTGHLDDGVAGLAAIQRASGLTIVQDPSESHAPDMPSAALARLPLEHALPLHRMGPARAIVEAAGEGYRPGVEAKIAAGEEVGMAGQEQLGEPAGLGCPECGGPLTRVDDPGIKRYRCHIGYAYTERALLAEQSDQVERALAAALRTLEERTRLYDDLARGLGHDDADASDYYRRADEARKHAETLRALVLRGAGADEAA